MEVPILAIVLAAAYQFPMGDLTMLQHAIVYSCKNGAGKMKPIERKRVFSKVFGRTLLEKGYVEKRFVFYKVDYKNGILKYIYMVSLAAGHGVKICFDIVPFVLKADPRLPQSNGYETFTLDDVYLQIKGTYGNTFGTDCYFEADFNRVMQVTLDEFKEVLLIPLNNVNSLVDYITFMEKMFPVYGMIQDRGIISYLANNDVEKARAVAQRAIKNIESVLNDECTMSILTDKKKEEYTARIAQLNEEMKNDFCTYRMKMADNERQSILINRSFFEKTTRP